MAAVGERGGGGQNESVPGTDSVVSRWGADGGQLAGGVAMEPWQRLVSIFAKIKPDERVHRQHGRLCRLRAMASCFMLTLPGIP